MMLDHKIQNIQGILSIPNILKEAWLREHQLTIIGGLRLIVEELNIIQKSRQESMEKGKESTCIKMLNGNLKEMKIMPKESWL